MTTNKSRSVQKVFFQWTGLVGLALACTLLLARQRHPYSSLSISALVLIFLFLSLVASYLWSERTTTKIILSKATAIFLLTVAILLIIIGALFAWSVSDSGFGSMDIAAIMPLAMLAYGSYIFAPSVSFAIALWLLRPWQPKQTTSDQAAVEASPTLNESPLFNISEILRSWVLPTSAKPPLLIVYLLLLAAYVWCLHKVTFWWTLGSHASCSNGPDGSHEFSSALSYLPFAIFAATAIVVFRIVLLKNNSFWKKISWMFLEGVISIFVTFGLVIGGVAAYSWGLQSYLCEIGPSIVHEPSCFRCWCQPCGG